ncbi:MAG: zinc ribbon domain-containing protein [Acidobacteriota bacterium]
MANCARCGAPLKPNKKFCTKCGLPVAPPIAPQEKFVDAQPTRPPDQTSAPGNLPQAFCIKCGAPLKANTRFCTRCGEPTLIVAPPGYSVPQPYASPTPQPFPAQSHLGQQQFGKQPVPHIQPGAPVEQPEFKIKPSGRVIQREGFPLRFVAAIIDGVITTVLVFALTLATGLLWISPVIIGAYYFIEVLFGYTIGKRLLGLMVLGAEGADNSTANLYPSATGAHLPPFEVTHDALKRRWQLKVGIICLCNLLITLLGQLQAPDPVRWLLLLPGIISFFASLSIFGAAKQTYYDKLSKTAVFKVDFQSAPQTARPGKNFITTFFESLSRFIKTNSGIFDKHGRFSVAGLLLLPFRIIKARFKAFVRGFLIGAIIHFLAVGLSGGFDDVAANPLASLLIPTTSSIYFPLASVLWMIGSMAFSYIRASRSKTKAPPLKFAASTLIPLFISIGWYLLLAKLGLADDGGLSEIASDPTNIINQGGANLAGQSAGLGGVPTGLGTAIGNAIPPEVNEEPPGDKSREPSYYASSQASDASSMSPSWQSSISPSGMASSESLSSGSSDSLSSDSSALSSSGLSSSSSLSSSSDSLSSSLSSSSDSLSSSLSSTSDSSLSSSDVSSSSSDSSVVSSDSSTSGSWESSASSLSESSSPAASESSSSGPLLWIISMTVIPTRIERGYDDPVWGPTVYYTFDITMPYINNTGDDVFFSGDSYTGGNMSDHEQIDPKTIFSSTVHTRWSYYLGKGQPVVFKYHIIGRDGIRSNTVTWSWRRGDAIPAPPSSSASPSAEPSSSSLSPSPSSSESSSLSSESSSSLSSASESSSSESSSSEIQSSSSSSESSSSESSASSSESASSESSSSESSASYSSSAGSSSESSSPSASSESSSSSAASSESPISEDELRRNIINAMNRANQTIGYDGHLDPNFWDNQGWVNWTLKPGVKPSDAIEAIFRNGSGSKMECLSAISAIYYKAILDTIGADKFNALFKNGMEVSTQSPVFNFFNTKDPSAPLEPGDWCYIKGHPDYHSEDFRKAFGKDVGAWQGENAIYLGNGKYTGLGLQEMTEDEMKQEMLKAYNDKVDMYNRTSYGRAHPKTHASINEITGLLRNNVFEPAI